MTSPTVLEVRNLRVAVEGKEVLKGVNMVIKTGEIHAVMGPNASGKSTLSHTIMGHPKYRVLEGDILLDGESILTLSPDKRAKKGLFLGFQYPVAIPGVSMFNFLRTALNATRSGGPVPTIIEFREQFRDACKAVEVEEAFGQRYVNEGFSGGERKRSEVLQMALLKPRLALLDEMDTGLDIDALKTVSDGLNRMFGDHMGVLLITHYNRILQYVKPHHVHVLVDGRFAASGGPELAEQLEQKGYGWVAGQ